MMETCDGKRIIGVIDRAADSGRLERVEIYEDESQRCFVSDYRGGQLVDEAETLISDEMRSVRWHQVTCYHWNDQGQRELVGWDQGILFSDALEYVKTGKNPVLARITAGSSLLEAYGYSGYKEGGN